MLCGNSHWQVGRTQLPGPVTDHPLPLPSALHLTSLACLRLSSGALAPGALTGVPLLPSSETGVVGPFCVLGSRGTRGNGGSVLPSHPPFLQLLSFTRPLLSHVPRTCTFMAFSPTPLLPCQHVSSCHFLRRVIPAFKKKIVQSRPIWCSLFLHLHPKWGVLYKFPDSA